MIGAGPLPLQWPNENLPGYATAATAGATAAATTNPTADGHHELEEGKRPPPPRQESASGLYKGPPAALLQDLSLCILPQKCP